MEDQRRRVYHGRSYEEEIITPEIAKKYLEKNRLDRKTRPKVMAQYAEMMAEEYWPLNGTCISFDWNDDLFDGQHRLQACVRSGVPFATLVVRGLDPSARRTIDGGLKRMFRDDLMMLGIRNADRCAALVRKIIIWNKRGGLATFTGTPGIRPEMNEWWEQPGNADVIVKVVSETSKWIEPWKGMNSGSLIFMYWLLMIKDGNSPDKVIKFFNILAHGSQDDRDEPVLRVKRMLEGEISKTRREKKEYGTPYDVYFLIWGWNKWLHGDLSSRPSLAHGGLRDAYPQRARALTGR